MERPSSSSRRQIRIALAVGIISLAGTAWFLRSSETNSGDGPIVKQDSFTPFYYPNRGDMKIFITGPQLRNIDAARSWVKDLARTRGDIGWDYEIGRNCRPFPEDPLFGVLCEETFK